MAKEPVTAFLGLGGNLGEPQSAMATALAHLEAQAAIEIVAVSSLFRTPPWGKTDQPDFLNAVARLQTTLEPIELLRACLAAENRLKRVRSERWGPRTIDIDLLLFGGRTIDEPGLRVPHPRLLERAFVLVPLAQIVPELELQGRTAAERAGELDRQGIVEVATPPDWWRAG